jgi:hypothetical protein
MEVMMLLMLPPDDELHELFLVTEYSVAHSSSSRPIHNVGAFIRDLIIEKRDNIPSYVVDHSEHIWSNFLFHLATLPNEERDELIDLLRNKIPEQVSKLAMLYDEWVRRRQRQQHKSKL